MYSAGFHPFPSPEDRIFTVQGDYGLCQCARARYAAFLGRALKGDVA